MTPKILFRVIIFLLTLVTFAQTDLPQDYLSSDFHRQRR